MEEWKEIRLEDACTALSDGLHKAPKFNLNGDYIFVNAKNIQYGFIVDNDPMKKSTYEEYVKYASPLNDTTILYSIDGTIGNVALYRGEKCILGKGACYINPNPKIIDRQFLYYYLQSDVFQRYVDKMSTGSTIKHISLKTMRNFILTYPSISTQQKIVDILSSIDKKITLNRKINSNLEEQAKALFKSWFIDFEPFKSGKFVESKLGKIPEGWEVRRLEEVSKIVGGGTPSKSKPQYFSHNGIHWITPKDLSLSHAKFTSSGADDITIEGYENSSAKLMPKGTVLFSSRAPVGYISIALNELCTNQGFKSVVPQELNTIYLYYYLKFHVKDIEAKASGSTFKEVSGSLMRSIPILVPIANVVDKFENILTPIFNYQARIEKESSRLSCIRDTLLPRLMSGEIEVRS